MVVERLDDIGCEDGLFQDGFMDGFVCAWAGGDGTLDDAAEAEETVVGEMSALFTPGFDGSREGFQVFEVESEYIFDVCLFMV